MAARSKARTDFNRSNIGIVGSNPARGMEVSSASFCIVLSCVCSGLATGRSPVQGVLLNAKKYIRKFHKSKLKSENARRPNPNLLFTSLL
jgi:hypothetical protein